MSDQNNLEYALKNAVNLINDHNLNEGIEQLKEIQKIFPVHPGVLELLASTYIKNNDPNKFLDTLDILIKNKINIKKHLESKYKILIYLGNLNDAIDCLKLLHKKYPSINTARELSNHYLEKNLIDDAEMIVQDFLESDKTYSELYKGIRHVKAGRNKLAEESYKKILKEDNNNVDALRLLGLLAFRNRNYSIAESLFIRAIKINPNFKLLWDNLAKCFRLQNKLQDAKKAFNNLLKLDPDNLEAMTALGTISIRLSQYEEGIKFYKKIININKINPRVYLSLGHAYKTIGQRNESEDSYLKAIKQFPLCGEGYWSLANLKTYKFSDKQINEMELCLTKEMHEVEKIQMFFALGKAYELKEDYRNSFKNYNQGNWMQRKKLDYNAQENSNQIDKIIHYFKNKKQQLNFNSGYSSSDPIFILGLPRSGSTLLEQILSSHSEIEGTHELHNIMTIGKRIKKINNCDDYLDNLTTLSDEEIKKYGIDYINETKWARNENKFFIDKMPNNFPHIGLIKMILPNAKIIDARRNPMDGCFSCFKQYFAKGQHFTYDLDDIARYYKDYTKIMNFWNSYFPNSIHTVLYENVINDPKKEISSMLEFLNLEFQESCMKFYKSPRPVKTASSEQVRQPIYKSGLQYWKNFESELTDLVQHFPDHE